MACAHCNQSGHYKPTCSQWLAQQQSSAEVGYDWRARMRVATEGARRSAQLISSTVIGYDESGSMTQDAIRGYQPTERPANNRVITGEPLYSVPAWVQQNREERMPWFLDQCNSLAHDDELLGEARSGYEGEDCCVTCSAWNFLNPEGFSSLRSTLRSRLIRIRNTTAQRIWGSEA
jgi:hypothetical protein